MVRIKLVLELSYVGTRYVGWQPQTSSEKPSTKNEETHAFRARSNSRSPPRHKNGLEFPDGVGQLSVQEVVDNAVSQVFSESEELKALVKGLPSGMVSSGRTDRGVHAQSMLAYCNCHTKGKVDMEKLDSAAGRLPQLLGKHLMSDVKCHAAGWMTDLSFCTRSGGLKTYSYYILEAPAEHCDASELPDCQSLSDVTWVLEGEAKQLDVDAMQRAAALLVGVNDFALLSTVPFGTKDTRREVCRAEVRTKNHVCFALSGVCYKSHCGAVLPSKCPICTEMKQTDMRETPSKIGTHTRLIVVSVTGMGFLRHMVRRIVGLLVDVGRGCAPEVRVTELFQAAAASRVGPDSPGPAAVAAAERHMPARAPRAPAHGLWLERVEVDSCEDSWVGPWGPLGHAPA